MIAIYRAMEVRSTGTASTIGIIDAEAKLLISQNIVISLCGHNLRRCAIAPLLVVDITAIDTRKVGNNNSTNNTQHGECYNRLLSTKALLEHDVHHDNCRSNNYIGERAKGIRGKGITAHILDNKSQLLSPIATTEGLAKACHAIVGNECHNDNHKHHNATRNTEGDILHLRRHLATEQPP